MCDSDGALGALNLKLLLLNNACILVCVKAAVWWSSESVETTVTQVFDPWKACLWVAITGMTSTACFWALHSLYGFLRRSNPRSNVLRQHLSGTIEDNDNDSNECAREPSAYLSWDDYFMAVAKLSSFRSKDPNTQVGACVVNSQRKVVGIGYNGMPIGCSDEVMPWRRCAERRNDTKYPYVCHAEMNAILNRCEAALDGATLYTVLFPCDECAKLVIQSRIARVLFVSDKYHDKEPFEASRRMLKMAGVSVQQYIPQKIKFTLDFTQPQITGVQTAEQMEDELLTKMTQ